MINFTRSFDSAWERMVVILFQPFDLGKWFVVGFSAFLAGLLAGGNSFNPSFNYNHYDRNNWSSSFSYSGPNYRQFHTTVTNSMDYFSGGVAIVVVLLFVAIVIGIVLLFYWLGARGQFMFLDNIVRNRGAIAWPWATYKRQANSLLGFFLLYSLISFVIFLPCAIAAFFLALPLVREQRWPEGGEIPVFVVLGIIYLVIGVALTVLIFLFRELGVPLMFRHGLLARPAFRETWQLIRMHPGSMFLFVLLRFALLIAMAVLSVVTCCCFCLGLLPYIGTIMLLPALIFIKCFTLDFLAQFGPEYDVWTVDVAPPGTLPGMASPPPPPV